MDTRDVAHWRAVEAFGAALLIAAQLPELLARGHHVAEVVSWPIHVSLASAAGSVLPTGVAIVAATVWSGYLALPRHTSARPATTPPAPTGDDTAGAP